MTSLHESDFTINDLLSSHGSTVTLSPLKSVNIFLAKNLAKPVRTTRSSSQRYS